MNLIECIDKELSRCKELYDEGQFSTGEYLIMVKPLHKALENLSNKDRIGAITRCH